MYHKQKSAVIAMTLLLTAVVGTLFMTSMIAQQVQGKSIISNVGDGYDEGKDQGKDDFRNGNGWNDNCPSNVGVQYCIGWISGYNVGYGSLKIADD